MQDAWRSDARASDTVKALAVTSVDGDSSTARAPLDAVREAALQLMLVLGIEANVTPTKTNSGLDRFFSRGGSVSKDAKQLAAPKWGMQADMLLHETLLRDHEILNIHERHGILPAVSALAVVSTVLDPIAVGEPVAATSSAPAVVVAEAADSKQPDTMTMKDSPDSASVATNENSGASMEATKSDDAQAPEGDTALRAAPAGHEVNAPEPEPGPVAAAVAASSDATSAASLDSGPEPEAAAASEAPAKSAEQTATSDVAPASPATPGNSTAESVIPAPFILDTASDKALARVDISHNERHGNYSEKLLREDLLTLGSDKDFAKKISSMLKRDTVTISGPALQLKELFGHLNRTNSLILGTRLLEAQNYTVVLAPAEGGSLELAMNTQNHCAIVTEVYDTDDGKPGTAKQAGVQAGSSVLSVDGENVRGDEAHLGITQLIKKGLQAKGSVTLLLQTSKPLPLVLSGFSQSPSGETNSPFTDDESSTAKSVTNRWRKGCVAALPLWLCSRARAPVHMAEKRSVWPSTSIAGQASVTRSCVPRAVSAGFEATLSARSLGEIGVTAASLAQAPRPSLHLQSQMAQTLVLCCRWRIRSKWRSSTTRKVASSTPRRSRPSLCPSTSARSSSQMISRSRLRGMARS